LGDASSPIVQDAPQKIPPRGSPSGYAARGARAAGAPEQSDDWKRAMTHLPLLVSLPPEPQSINHLADQLSWNEEAVSLATQLWEKGLPPLVDTACLPYLFGVSGKLISAMGRFPDRYYRTFVRPKKDGGVREISGPRRFLKVIQWWINEHILAHQSLNPYVMGFVRGKSIFDNGRPHAGAKNLMVVDVEDFFPSVTISQVVPLFHSMGFPEAVSRQLARLCCRREVLPQGAPTSPAVANLVFLPADEALAELAQRWRCQYTRYADDLAFSGSRRFTREDMLEVETVLRRHGFRVNRTKSRRVGAGARHTLTGLVVNVSPQPPRWKRRLWRAMFHRASNHPEEFGDRLTVLTGIAAFTKQFQRSLAAEYLAVVREVRRRAAAG